MTDPWTPPETDGAVPGVWRIARTDTVAGTAAFAFVLAWVLLASAIALGRVPDLETDAGPLVLTIAATVVGVTVLAWRVMRIRRVFARGRAVRAVVDHVLFHRGRGRIGLAYEIDGREHHARIAVHQTLEARLLRVGDPVDVAVDPERPDVALPFALFGVSRRAEG